MVVGAMLSMWITNMAVAAMLLPLGVSILEEEGCERLKSNFGKALMISCVWGPLIGGIGTPAGAGPNPIAIGFLKEMAGVDLSFTQWMLYGIPAVILLLPIGWVLLMIMFKPEVKHLKKTKEELRHEFDNYPPMDREEKLTLVIFVLTRVPLADIRVLRKASGHLHSRIHARSLYGDSLLFPWCYRPEVEKRSRRIYHGAASSSWWRESPSV